MVDAERHPAIVEALGGAGTLLLARHPACDIALRGGRVRAGYIVVPRLERPGAMPDRVLQRFPRSRTTG